MPVKVILPQLSEQVKDRIPPDELHSDADLPIFTIIFDREAYSPKFFQQLWNQRIAVLTYRKYVKDKWQEQDFVGYTIEIDGYQTKMKLCEKKVVLNGVEMCEIRRLTEDGHQTSVITTNKKLSLVQLARFMFARWCKETKQAKIIEELNALEAKTAELLEKRSQFQYKIPLKLMPKSKRYNRLKQERNQFLNILKEKEILCLIIKTTH